jgi:hypothetical protein
MSHLCIRKTQLVTVTGGSGLYKAVVKTEESGPFNVRIYVLSEIIIDGNDCLLV